MLQLKLPSWATIALGVGAAVLNALNTITFGFGPPWKEAVTVGLFFLTGLGISPLIGAAFRNALHLSHNVVVFLTASTATLGVVIQTFSMSTDLKGILIGVITLVDGVVFGTAPGAPPIVARPAA